MATEKNLSVSAAEVQELVAKIDEAPDKLHGDFTPAVHRLIEIGEPALELILGLILSAEEPTRLRAQRVLEGVVMRLHGFRPGQGWEDEPGEARYLELWRRLGDLHWQGSLAERRAAVELWREWLEERRSASTSEEGFLE